MESPGPARFGGRSSLVCETDAGDANGGAVFGSSTEGVRVS